MPRMPDEQTQMEAEDAVRRVVLCPALERFEPATVALCLIDLALELILVGVRPDGVGPVVEELQNYLFKTAPDAAEAAREIEALIAQTSRRRP